MTDEKTTPHAPHSPPLKPPLPKKAKIVLDLKTIIALMVGVIILGTALSMLDVNDISKGYMESIATNTLKTPVRIGKLDIDTREKRITASNLMVANPEGFTKSWAMGAGSIDITIESGTPQQIVLREVNVTGARILFEVEGDQTNLTTIQKNMNRLAAVEAGDKDKSGKPPIAVVIRSLKIDGSELLPHIAGADMNAMVFPPLQMTGIGEDTGGILVSQIIGQIMDRVTQQAVAQALEANLLSSMSDQALQDIKASLGLDMLGQARSTINQWGEQLQEHIGVGRR
jgi:hypothetical protein